MIVPDIKANTFENFDVEFQRKDRRIIETTTIMIEYVFRKNKVGKYKEDWSNIEERLNN